MEKRINRRNQPKFGIKRLPGARLRQQRVPHGKPEKRIRCGKTTRAQRRCKIVHAQIEILIAGVTPIVLHESNSPHRGFAVNVLAGGFNILDEISRRILRKAWRDGKRKQEGETNEAREIRHLHAGGAQNTVADPVRRD